MHRRPRLGRSNAVRTGLVLAAGLIAAAVSVAVAAGAPPYRGVPMITSVPFGVANGQNVTLYTLTNSHGMEVKIMTYGGIIQSVRVPDKSHRLGNVTLGFPTLADYVNLNSPYPAGGPYFGALIGRYANRIAGGTFQLNGQTYNLALNNGPNSLHGGIEGFDNKVWTPTVIGPTSDSVGLKLHYLSPDGEEGYPADLSVDVTMTLTDDNEIRFDYSATNESNTLSTVVNLTNHSYWNLRGEGSGTILDENLTIYADHYTPVDSTQIPTGAFDPVAGTPMDFTKSTPIGARIDDNFQQLLIGHGYDHNYVLNRPSPTDTSMIHAAHVQDKTTHRILDIYTTEPGIQFYSGNFLDGTLIGTSGHAYEKNDGFALETQHYPDSPHHQGDPNWPSVVLGPGNTYTSHTIYRFSVGPK
jgi:aldose 1-epimerase